MKTSFKFVENPWNFAFFTIGKRDFFLIFFILREYFGPKWIQFFSYFTHITVYCHLWRILKRRRKKDFFLIKRPKKHLFFIFLKIYIYISLIKMKKNIKYFFFMLLIYLVTFCIYQSIWNYLILSSKIGPLKRLYCKVSHFWFILRYFESFFFKVWFVFQKYKKI